MTFGSCFRNQKGGNDIMSDKDIYRFIEEMEAIGDIWEYEDAKRVYGHMSLEEALSDRKACVSMHLNNIAKAHLN